VATDQNPPVNTAAVVKGLAHPEFLVEMDAIAVVPAEIVPNVVPRLTLTT
jgi:enamine deaminase RidA (YjgF/YER057c/UK114 family)